MSIKVSKYPWGNERIVWGYQSDHKYTFKILEPKRGRPGCLSLQYHNEKSESWLVVRGVAWALAVVDNMVCTKILRAGEFVNLPVGIIHRLMAISEDLQVAEPSTLDRNAADPNAVKDVVRLACVHGRECASPRSLTEAELVREAVRLSEEAIACIEKGDSPPEHHPEQFLKLGLSSLSAPLA